MTTVFVIDFKTIAGIALIGATLLVIGVMLLIDKARAKRR